MQVGLPGLIIRFEDVRFLCTATLIALSPTQRWWFYSCTVCHCSASPDGTVYKCLDPNCSGTNAIPRYRICYRAADGKNEIGFLFFDRVGRQLIGTHLISLLRHGRPPAMPLSKVTRHGRPPTMPLSKVTESVRGELSIPRELLCIVWRKFRFVVFISNECFTKEGSNLSFQVLRIDAPFGKVSAPSVFYRASSSTSGSASINSDKQTKDPLLSPKLPLVAKSISDVVV